MTRLITAGVCLLLLCASTSFAATKASYEILHDPIGAIEADYEAGVLTYSEKAILQIKAIKAPDQLPAEYQIFEPTTQRSHSRSATLIIRDILTDWDILDGSAQAYISSVMTRWSTTYEYVSPSGYFRLHYNISGTHAVPVLDADSDGVPDYVERAAAYMDSSKDVHDVQGYLMPPSDGTRGGDSKFDVYFENMSYYGYAVPEFTGPEPWNDYGSYLVLHNTYTGFPPNYDPEGNQAGAAKATAAHEFHHCVQFAYDASESGWFMELDATHMEDIVYDHVDDNYNYISAFTQNPQTSLMEESIHAYASFIWGMYLVERFDTSLIKAAWEGARYSTIYTAVSDTLLGRYGWTQDSAFADFSLWNYFTGSRDDGLHYEEGSHYLPATAIKKTFSAYPVPIQVSPVGVAGYGACYIQFNPTGDIGKLRITFDGDNAGQWAAYVIKAHTDGSHTIDQLPLAASGWTGLIDVQDFNTYLHVTLVGINTQEFGSSRTFSYSASMLQPYEFTTSFVTDSQLYVNVSRIVNLRVKNLSPFSNAIKVVFWDAVGWVNAGNTSFTLQPGDSTVVGAVAKVPLGTSIGMTSQLTFSVESLNDPQIKETRQRNEVVVVQRGDINASGVIDGTDLAHLVSYMTIGLPVPNPLESANFNCMGIVDLPDLSMMIAYLTAGGLKPVCNPY